MATEHLPVTGLGMNCADPQAYKESMKLKEEGMRNYPTILPSDDIVVFLVADFLTVQDICRCSEVCQAWRKLLSSNGVWKRKVMEKCGFADVIMDLLPLTLDWRETCKQWSDEVTIGENTAHSAIMNAALEKCKPFKSYKCFYLFMTPLKWGLPAWGYADVLHKFLKKWIDKLATGHFRDIDLDLMIRSLMFSYSHLFEQYQTLRGNVVRRAYERLLEDYLNSLECPPTSLHELYDSWIRFEVIYLFLDVVYHCANRFQSQQHSNNNKIYHCGVRTLKNAMPAGSSNRPDSYTHTTALQLWQVYIERSKELSMWIVDFLGALSSGGLTTSKLRGLDRMFRFLNIFLRILKDEEEPKYLLTLKSHFGTQVLNMSEARGSMLLHRIYYFATRLQPNTPPIVNITKCYDGVTGNSWVHELVVSFLKHEVEEPCPLLPRPIPTCAGGLSRLVPKWHSNFIGTLKRKQIFELIVAANFLGVISLMHLGCGKIATDIRGKSPGEIRNLLAETA